MAVCCCRGSLIESWSTVVPPSGIPRLIVGAMMNAEKGALNLAPSVFEEYLLTLSPVSMLELFRWFAS